MCRLRVSVLRKVTAMEPQAPWSIYHATQIPWGEVIQTSPHATVERKRRGGGGQQWEKWDTPPKIHAHQEPECQNVLFFGNKILVDVISYDDEVLLHGGWGGGMQPRDPCLPLRGKLGPGHTPRWGLFGTAVTRAQTPAFPHNSRGRLGFPGPTQECMHN